MIISKKNLRRSKRDAVNSYRDGFRDAFEKGSDHCVAGDDFYWNGCQDGRFYRQRLSAVERERDDLHEWISATRSMNQTLQEQLDRVEENEHIDSVCGVRWTTDGFEAMKDSKPVNDYVIDSDAGFVWTTDGWKPMNNGEPATAAHIAEVERHLSCGQEGHEFRIDVDRLPDHKNKMGVPMVCSRCGYTKTVRDDELTSKQVAALKELGAAVE